jgi:hypothetical protein
MWDLDLFSSRPSRSGPNCDRHQPIHKPHHLWHAIGIALPVTIDNIMGIKESRIAYFDGSYYTG